jgi:uncharacterized DUF497 family protein
VSKHGVSFDEAATVFEDLLARIFDDELHSANERREIIIGPFDKQPVAVGLFYGTAK